MKPLHSMTGFGTAEGELAGLRYRVEMKALNHRFLDLKLRLPRELQAFELQVRKLVEGRFARGAVELKVERLDSGGSPDSAPQLNLTLAAHYYESLTSLQKALGLQDPIRTIDIATMPEVLSRTDSQPPAEDAWEGFERLLASGCDSLASMRATEGANLRRILQGSMDELGALITDIRSRRTEWEATARKRHQERIRGVFEAHPLPPGSAVQPVLESRIAQELALLLDRTDVAEELDRFEAHLGHFRKTLDEGSPVGRKLDFILQELGREVNTLANKAQDHGISEQAVQIKVRIEQIREQSMNLE